MFIEHGGVLEFAQYGFLNLTLTLTLSCCLQKCTTNCPSGK